MPLPIDKTGKEVIPLKYTYTSVDKFVGGLAKAELNGKYGYIDKTGKEVIPIKCEAEIPLPSAFSDGLAYVELNGKKFYIDKNGTEYYEP